MKAHVPPYHTHPQVGILINGLQQRDARLRQQADSAWAALQMELVNLECFRVRVWWRRYSVSS